MIKTILLVIETLIFILDYCTDTSKLSENMYKHYLDLNQRLEIARIFYKDQKEVKTLPLVLRK